MLCGRHLRQVHQLEASAAASSATAEAASSELKQSNQARMALAAALRDHGSDSQVAALQHQQLLVQLAKAHEELQQSSSQVSELQV
jgi:hypothetical protein